MKRFKTASLVLENGARHAGHCATDTNYRQLLRGDKFHSLACQLADLFPILND